jgi:hypothetical protein
LENRSAEKSYARNDTQAALVCRILDMGASMQQRGGLWRSRWAAIGAAIAVTLGFGGLVTVSLAAPSSGPGSTGSFKAIAPVRILDTRPAPENVGGIAGPVGPGGTITLQVGGVGPVPANAISVVMNVTVTGTTNSSFLTVFPSDQPRPTASNLNWVAGDVIPNLVTVTLSADGKVSFYNHEGDTHVVVDVAGYYVAGNDKFLSLPITGSILVGPGVEVSEAHPGGIRFPDNGFGSFSRLITSFVVPPDYTTGTPINVLVNWSVPGTCSIALQPNNLTVTRPGIPEITGLSTSAGWTIGPSTSAGAGVTAQTVGTIVTPNPAIPLSPGDTILIGIFRRGDAAQDTCAGLTATITGLSVNYQ